jgi:hypothetical protein
LNLGQHENFGVSLKGIVEWKLRRILDQYGGTFEGNWNKSSRIVGKNIGNQQRIHGEQSWDNIESEHRN